MTDFLFFVSSSTIKRFGEHPNIRQHISLDPEQIERTSYDKVHRLVLDYYRTLIPERQPYYLAGFSLKKNSGLFGLIFGSGHVYGMEKFLTACWGQDSERGEANFDIDEDNVLPGQYDLLTGEVEKPKKVDVFEKELAEKILSGKIRDDKQIYLFALENGFLPRHAKSVISDLVKSGKIVLQKLSINHKVCGRGAVITSIKLL